MSTLEGIVEWPYCKALETVITILVKARDLGWGEWTLFTPIDTSKSYMVLKIADKCGDHHWFRISATGEIIPQPVQMTCF